MNKARTCEKIEPIDPEACKAAEKYAKQGWEGDPIDIATAEMIAFQAGVEWQKERNET